VRRLIALHDGPAVMVTHQPTPPRALSGNFDLESRQLFSGFAAPVPLVHMGAYKPLSRSLWSSGARNRLFGL
jgi:hypothetical protein